MSKYKEVKGQWYVSDQCPNCRKHVFVAPGAVPAGVNCKRCGKAFYVELPSQAKQSPQVEHQPPKQTVMSKYIERGGGWYVFAHCPNCHNHVGVMPNHSGQDVACGKCGHTFFLPLPMPDDNEVRKQYRSSTPQRRQTQRGNRMGAVVLCGCLGALCMMLLAAIGANVPDDGKASPYVEKATQQQRNKAAWNQTRAWVRTAPSEQVVDVFFAMVEKVAEQPLGTTERSQAVLETAAYKMLIAEERPELLPQVGGR